MARLLFLFIALLVSAGRLNAQCGSFISTFPYSEDFEVSQGNWTSGGNNASWAWGTPSKAQINSAGSGSKCWVTGGLVGSNYNSCERSYVVSPCFDFTNLSNPIIALKVFWECEFQYDGAVLQYSTNGGTSWSNVGAFGDTNNCFTKNWYNYNNITHLGSSGGCTSPLTTIKHGWCGNTSPTVGSCQGGNGSNGWRIAQHCLKNLGGLPSVRFRFAFGAGSNCNAFDGVAFDSVAIYNAPPLQTGFVQVCYGPNSIAFIDTIGFCSNTYDWNFGNPSSGASNTSTTLVKDTALHSYFAGNGSSYTISVTTNNECYASTTTTIIVSTIAINTNATPAICNGDSSATISIASSGFIAPVSYQLSPGIYNNSSGNFNNLAAGLYTVSVSDNKSCTVSTIVTISQPPPLNLTILPTSSSSICNSGTGKIEALLTAALGVVTYKLSPQNISNTSGIFTNLNAGSYTITATNSAGCKGTATHLINGSANFIINSVIITPARCYNTNDAKIQVNATGGGGNYTYLLQPSNITSPNGQFSDLLSGTYTVTAIDANTCFITSIVTIANPTKLYISNITVSGTACGTPNQGSISCSPAGGTSNIAATLQPGNLASVNYSWYNLAIGTYTLELKDNNGCLYDTTVSIMPTTSSLMLLPKLVPTSCEANSHTGQASLVIVGGIAPYNIAWQTNPGSIADTAKGLYAGTYIVQVSDAVLCTASTIFTITSDNCCKELKMHNAFSPNEDNVNDNFAIKTGVPIQLLRFSVYDRWGQEVYATQDASAYWDGYYRGKACEQGVYYYLINYLCLSDGKEYTYKGDVTLLK
jgi:gliding motility-associated-like protein